MPEWVTLLGSIAGSLTVALTLFWKFLSRHQRLQDKLEAQTRLHITEKFTEQTYEITQVKAQLIRVETKLFNIAAQTGSNRERSEKVLKALEEFIKDTEKRFKAIETSDIVQIGPESWMLKAK